MPHQKDIPRGKIARIDAIMIHSCNHGPFQLPVPTPNAGGGTNYKLLRSLSLSQR